MEFWGVEVKAGEPVKVTPEAGQIIHVSQAAMGEGKKGKGNDHSLESDEEEDAHIGIMGNGEIKPEVKEAKPAASKGKAGKPESSAKAKVVVEPKKEDESDEDDDDESEDEDMLNASDDISDSDDSDAEDDSEDEDEETPQKAVSGQKRPIKSATKTPVAAKKAKSDTPQKTDGKKGGGHTATPHPSKNQGKTAANSNKSKEKTPKSDGKISCKSCTKIFTSETGLESHTKAKHSGK
ncbi:hypothetical protein RHMOL_Rhmol13G0135900 [Rhododendron molle]|uniref:Uncharacterized protein n=1 Tax=Rhododendron molle TaxID=49168 RepID=A0ACC0L686_RHOML|nr:hypothetical protein RHMOL_Rhmol13G0135900 [Rhododendron molle]